MVRGVRPGSPVRRTKASSSEVASEASDELTRWTARYFAGTSDRSQSRQRSGGSASVNTVTSASFSTR